MKRWRCMKIWQLTSYFFWHLKSKIIQLSVAFMWPKIDKQTNKNVTLPCANKQPLQRWWSWSYIIIRKIGMFAFFVFVLQNSICHHSNCQFWGYEWHSYAQIKCYFLQTKKTLNLSLNEFGDIWTTFSWDIYRVKRVLSFEGGLPS
jgi:hypothetical protein